MYLSLNKAFLSPFLSFTGGSISKSFLYAWRNAGITPILSKSSYGFGEGKCLGGGTYINGGLIWRTPKIVLDNWNQKLKTNKTIYVFLKGVIFSSNKVNMSAYSVLLPGILLNWFIS